MEDFIYLEVDEEITSIIDRIHKVRSDKFGLVVPRGAAVLQSIVNLKLIKKEVEKAGKTVAVITVDKIGRNLVSQVGLPVYDDVKQAAVTVAGSGKKQPPVNDVIEIDMSQEDGEGGQADTKDGTVPEGVNVHYYDDKASSRDDAILQQKSPKDHSGTAGQKATADARFKSRSIAGDANKAMQEVMKSKSPSRPNTPRRRRLKIVLAIAAALVAVIAIWVVTTRAEVKIGVVAEAFEDTADVTIDAASLEGDLEGARIPGVLVEASKEAKQTLKATGKKQVGDRASGKLSFYNDSGIDQVINGGTVLTSGGKKFILDATITVPKATLDAGGNKVQGKVDGNATAQDPGSEFNMPDGTSYAVSGNGMVTAKGAMTGGTTKEVTIVADNDIADSRDKLVYEASAELRDQIKNEAKKQYVIESAINYSLDGFTSNKNANDEADSFEVQATIKAQVVVFDEAKLREFMAQHAGNNLPEGKSLLSDDSDTITPSLVSIDLPKKEMAIKATLKSHVGDALDTSGLALQIRGRTVKRAREIIAAKLGNDNIEITIRPNIGVVRLPFLSKNIRFKLDYLNQTQESGNQEPSQ